MKPKTVSYQYIANDSARKACLNRRRSSLINKVEEMTKLCGVNAFLVIYSLNEAEPIFWPSREDVLQIMHQYLQLPEMEKNRKKMNQESYMKDKVKKLEDQVMQLSQRSREMEAHLFMRQMRKGGKPLNQFSSTELCRLEEYAQEKLTMLKARKNRTLPSSTTVGAGMNLQVQENQWADNSDPWLKKNPHSGEGSASASAAGEVMTLNPPADHFDLEVQCVAGADDLVEGNDMFDLQASPSEDSGDSDDPIAP